MASFEGPTTRRQRSLHTQRRWALRAIAYLLLAIAYVGVVGGQADEDKKPKRMLLASGPNSTTPVATPAPPVCTADCGQGSCVTTGTSPTDYVCACITTVSTNSVPSDPKSKCTIPATNPCLSVDCGVAGQCVRSASLTDYTCQCRPDAVQMNPGEVKSKCFTTPTACLSNPCGSGTCGTDGTTGGFKCTCPAGAMQVTPQSPCITLTPAPTVSPCTGISCGKGGCVVTGTGTPTCVCDPGAVLSNPAQLTSSCILPSGAATSAPAVTPVPTPANPCTTGSYQCPGNSVGCIPTGKTSYVCACADGSRVNSAGQSCPSTPAATPTPPAATEQNPGLNLQILPNPTPAPTNPVLTLPTQGPLTQTPPSPTRGASTPVPTSAGQNFQNPGQNAASGSSAVGAGSGSGSSSSSRDTGISVGLFAFAACLAATAGGIIIWVCRKRRSSDSDDDVIAPRTPLHPPSKLTSNVPSAAQYAENLRARPTSPRVVPYLAGGDDAAADAEETPRARELSRQPSSARSVRTPSYSKRYEL